PLLVVSGKMADARQLIADHRTTRDIEQFAAAFQVVADNETFNLDATLPGRTVGDWQAPLDAAVTLILAHHGRWDDALAWAMQAADEITRTEGTILWAESFVRLAVPAGDEPGFERAV